jgi:hypothetical protein
LDIYLSINNRERVLRIPVLPPEFTIKSPQGNEVYQTAIGYLNLIGNLEPKGLSWEGTFPAQAVSYSRNKSMFGWDFVNELETMRKRKIPFRVIITDTPINMAVTIDNFEYGMKAGTKDIRYSIELKEFPGVS